MTMNAELASHYGTAGFGQPTQEDQELVAQADMLAKVAAANGIDIDTLTDEQVLGLAQQMEMLPSGEEKVAEANIQEADMQGRIMAHSYVDELNKIAAAGGLPGGAVQEEAQPSEDEVLQAMAVDRATNYAAHLGYDVAPVEEVKVASPVVEQAIEARAVEILTAEGLI